MGIFVYKVLQEISEDRDSPWNILEALLSRLLKEEVFSGGKSDSCPMTKTPRETQKEV